MISQHWVDLGRLGSDWVETGGEGYLGIAKIAETER